MSRSRPTGGVIYLQDPRKKRQEAEREMFAIESASFAAIFFMFLKRAWLHVFRMSANFVLLPVIAVMELGQAAIAIYEARKRWSPRLVARATIAGVSAAAVTTVVVGYMMFAGGVITAGTTFLTMVLPLVLGGSMLARGLYHLAVGFQCLDKQNNDLARDHLLRAAASLFMGVAYTALLVTAAATPIGWALLGIAGGTIGVGYAVYKFSESRRKKILPLPVDCGSANLRVEDDSNPAATPSPVSGNTLSIHTGLGRQDSPKAQRQQTSSEPLLVTVSGQQGPSASPDEPSPLHADVMEDPHYSSSFRA